MSMNCLPSDLIFLMAPSKSLNVKIVLIHKYFRWYKFKKKTILLNNNKLLLYYRGAGKLRMGSS